MPTSSVAEKSLALCQLYEAELLLELMLRHWQHPCADDAYFRSQLLETATEALRASVSGAVLIEGISPSNMNLVAAVWYAESRSSEDSQDSPSILEQRELWSIAVRHSVPSCFCDPDLLD
ncbi:MAG: hypothetical protein HUU20_12040 [Pirellulales bacterium]|nr:hypothetical protein [Pirellulales bacterium]